MQGPWLNDFIFVVHHFFIIKKTLAGRKLHLRRLF